MRSHLAQQVLGEPELRTLLRQNEWTPLQARRVLQAQQSSGLTVLAFSRQAGIGCGRLYYWRRCLRAEPTLDSQGTDCVEPVAQPGFPPPPAALPAPFVSLRLSEPSQKEAPLESACAELVHPSGWRLRLTPQAPTAWLQVLGRAMRASC